MNITKQNDSATQIDVFENVLDTLMEEFMTSILALQTQNHMLADQCLMKVQGIQQVSKDSLSSEQKKFIDLAVNQLQVMKYSLTLPFLKAQGRQAKVIENLQLADKLCSESLELFEQLQSSNINNDLLEMIVAVVVAFERIVGSQLIHEKAIQRRLEKKFVDDVKVAKEQLSCLRKIRPINWTNTDNEVHYLLSAMLEKHSEMIEIQIERLVELRKKIQFIIPHSNSIFIVHGHDTAILLELNEMLSASFDVNPIILSRMPDCGQTIIEKFENYGKDCSFAFVIVTPDDLVSKSGSDYMQARPNVIFELGWFCGRFGRSRVRIIKKRSTILPSDLDGIVTIEFESSIEEVFRKIGADLELGGLLA